MMESLLCNEVWLMMSPTVEHADEVVHEYHNSNSNHQSTTSFYSNMEDCEQAFAIFQEKEALYLPERVYVNQVKANYLIDSARFKAICWFLKSQSRLNLSLETVFSAANYFDRFSSLRKCQAWNDGMFELLYVSCLSIASKLNETNPPSLPEIQEGCLDNSFESSLIQRMELILLKALEWRLGPITSYSYIELLTRSIIGPMNKHLFQEFNARVTDMLVDALLDSKFLEFRPCVIAMSAVQQISKEFPSPTNDSFFTHFSALIPPDQKDELIKCCKMMADEKLVDEFKISPAKKTCMNCPSSPVTVLATDYCHDLCECQDDLSLLKVKNVDPNYFGRSRKKRMREEQNFRV